MAAKAKKKQTANKAKGVDLSRLSQAEAASLIGKPAVWLRDNAHLFSRNEDGSYDGRDIVRATQSPFRAADLTDSELEPVMQFCEHVAFEVGNYGSTARLFERIEQSHGASGLAAVGQQMLDTMRKQLQLYGEPEPETAEKIQKEADERIDRLESEKSAQNYRSVLVCYECGQYRWGRVWKSGLTPSGYAPITVICPPCERPSRRRRKAH